MEPVPPRVMPLEPAPAPAAPDLFDRMIALLEVALVAVAGGIAALLILAMVGGSGERLTQNTGWLVAFMGLETTITLLLIVVLLRLRGQSPTDLGLIRPLVRNLALGLAFVPLLFGVTLVTGLGFRRFAPHWVTEVNPLLNLIQTPGDVALMITASLYTGGFKEEIQRAFALLRFETHLGGVWVGLALWTLFFAIGHTYQGLDSAVGAGLLGLIFGLLYLWRRNLWVPIAAHAAFNVSTILLYWM